MRQYEVFLNQRLKWNSLGIQKLDHFFNNHSTFSVIDQKYLTDVMMCLYNVDPDDICTAIDWLINTVYSVPWSSMLTNWWNCMFVPYNVQMSTKYQINKWIKNRPIQMNKVEKKPIKSNFKARVLGFLGDSKEEAFQERGDEWSGQDKTRNW